MVEIRCDADDGSGLKVSSLRYGQDLDAFLIVQNLLRQLLDFEAEEALLGGEMMCVIRLRDVKNFFRISYRTRALLRMSTNFLRLEVRKHWFFYQLLEKEFKRLWSI